MIKVVLDTNVLISAYFHDDPFSTKIWHWAEAGDIDIIWSEPILDEMELILARVHARKFFRDEVKHVLRLENEACPKKFINVIKEDQQDNKILEAALAQKAKYIVTDDHHLIDAKPYHHLKIMHPQDFVLLKEQQILEQ